MAVCAHLTPFWQELKRGNYTNLWLCLRGLQDLIRGLCHVWEALSLGK